MLSQIRVIVKGHRKCSLIIRNTRNRNRKRYFETKTHKPQNEEQEERVKHE